MKKIIILLIGVLNQEKPDSINFIIANYLITHMEQIPHMSLNSIASACHVSSASVSRFCKSIGLNDFFEMRYLMKNYNIEVAAKFNYRQVSDDYVSDFVEDVKHHLDILHHINRNQLNQLITDIDQYKKVVLMGHVQSANVAYNLQHDISPYFKFIYCAQDHQVQRNYFLESGKDTLIIIFSARGNFLKKVFPRDRVKKRENGPKVYLITTSTPQDTSYYDQIIQLNDKYMYSSSLPLLQTYAQLISVGYKHLKDVSKYETNAEK